MPSGLTSSSITANTATVSWGAVTNAISYNLEYEASGASGWTTVTGVTSASYPLSGLSATTTYNFAVAATCSAGTGAYSSTSSFTTLSPCTVPSGLASSAVTTSSATVSWGAVSGATSYNLEYKTSGATSWTVITGVTSSSYGLSSLNSGTTYDYAVATVCSAGTGSYSAAATLTTLTPCGVPGSLASSSITTTTATVSWGTVSGATSYDLEYKTSSATSWTTITGTTSTSYGLSSLTAATTYDFAVAAVCASGTSAYSTAATFTTSSSVTYCTSKGQSEAYEYIKNVTVGSFSNTTTTITGYGNFTNLTIPLSSGASTTMTLTPGFTGASYHEYWVIYIDLKGDGLFTDAGDKIAEGNGTGAVSGSITIPSGVSLTTRMRVIMQYGAYISSPCVAFTYGETEDYTVSITTTAEPQIGSVVRNNDNDVSILAEEEGGDMVTSIYPNPTSHLVNVLLSPVENVAPNVQIIDVTGQTLISYFAGEMDRQATLDVSALPAGVYIVRTIYGNDRVSTEKLVKQ